MATSLRLLDFYGIQGTPTPTLNSTLENPCMNGLSLQQQCN